MTDRRPFRMETADREEIVRAYETGEPYKGEVIDYYRLVELLGAVSDRGY